MRKKANFYIWVLGLCFISMKPQTPAGEEGSIQINVSDTISHSPYLSWDYQNNYLKLLNTGTGSAQLFLKSESTDYCIIHGENYEAYKSRLVFEVGDDGIEDYILFRNTDWVHGSRDVFEIHRNATKANTNFYVMNGDVGIGTTTPDEKLAVAGVIHSQEVKIDLHGWPDFVFEKTYPLPSLEEVYRHIQEKGHLQNIPSAKEVAENGVLLGDMNSKLLQKIEELTLYIIQQDHKLKDQENRLQTLEVLLKK